jgi:hypothetical protein
MDVRSRAEPAKDERFTFTLAESEGLLSPAVPRQRGRPERTAEKDKDKERKTP